MASTLIILAVIGTLALIIELVIPGGVLGVAGILCLLAAAVLSFVEYGFLVGFLVSLAIGLMSFGMLWLWMRHFHRLPGTRNLVLQRHLDRGDSQPEEESLVGRAGEALTEIAPSGRARCGTTRYDVIAESGAIAKGARIEFVRRSGPSWVVRPA